MQSNSAFCEYIFNLKPCICGNERTNERSEQNSEVYYVTVVYIPQILKSIVLISILSGCYAPNGFHSEKPVLCGLAADNRIITVFKEQNSGRREELENVEVKLLEAGMYVYGLHSSGHEFVTDELWAAFYKMLLERRLVPRIILYDESPAFTWLQTIAYLIDRGRQA